jgi:hypothetical protein
VGSFVIIAHITDSYHGISDRIRVNSSPLNFCGYEQSMVDESGPRLRTIWWICAG